MKKLTSMLAIAALAFAVTSAPVSACDGSTASANGKTCNKQTSASSNCSKGTSATTASADGEACDLSKKDCPLANGKFSVASFNVEGMTCGGCETGLTTAFEAVNGVVMIPNMSYAAGTAKVIYDPTLTNVDALTKVVSDAGFKSNIMTAGFTTSDAGSKSNGSCCASKGAKATKTGSSASCSMSKGKATTASADGKSCNASKGAKATTTGSKASCSMSKGSATTASSGQACPHATNGDMITASADGTTKACSQLTSVERKAFCKKFCKSAMKSAMKSDKKSSDI